MILTQAKLKELVWYNPDTGTLHWQYTRGTAVKDQRVGYRHTNVRNKTTYLRAEILGKKYFVHVLIWLYHTGQFPNGGLDHKDRNGMHNQFENLREATSSQNKFNSGLQICNTTGAAGVTRHKSKWRAQITKEGKKIHIGLFSSKLEAILARAEMADKLFGEFHAR